MCRFLLASSKKMLDSALLLKQFADMAEKSRTVDGDRQGDGWGVAFKEFPTDEWKVHKSLLPIWEDRKVFETLPPSTTIAIHARSASFRNQIGVIEYNQPYISNNLCFVFNGVLKGVGLNRPLAGTIGAQKIFSLVQEEILHASPSQTLHTIDEVLRKHAREVIGLNIGIITKEGMYALCDYKENPEYFGIHWCKNDMMDMICSEPLEGYNWKQMSRGEILSV